MKKRKGEELKIGYPLLLLLLLSRFSHVRLLATPWTTAHQAPPSMGFSRQEYWSGVPLPSPLPISAAATAAKSLQSCPTLCDPIDGSPPGSTIPGILPPGKNTGVGCHFLLQCMKVKSQSEVAQSCLTLATLWTAVYQAPLSMGFSRQEYRSGVPLPSLSLLCIDTVNPL